MRINGKNISVVASDFDGTILRDGAMEPSTKFYEVVDKLQKENIFFIAASGRQYQNLNRLLSRLGQDIAYIAENGCLVMYKDEVIYSSMIEEDLAFELIQDMKLQPNTEILVSGITSC